MVSASVQGGSKVRWTWLQSQLRTQGIDVDALNARIRQVICKSLVCVEDSIPNCVNSFEVFGYDILIDDTYRPWLIEVNASPSMECETELDRLVKPQMIHDTVHLVNPLPFDRAYLSDLCERKLSSGVYEPKIPKTKEQKKLCMNAMLSRILQGRTPRLYGELPCTMGAYRRIAPGVEFEQIMRMKRAAFQPSSSVEGKYRRTLPQVV